MTDRSQRDDLIAVMGDPKRHPFDTNGFPVETCRKCGWTQDAHKEEQP